MAGGCLAAAGARPRYPLERRNPEAADPAPGPQPFPIAPSSLETRTPASPAKAEVTPRRGGCVSSTRGDGEAVDKASRRSLILVETISTLKKQEKPLVFQPEHLL